MTTPYDNARFLRDPDPVPVTTTGQRSIFVAKPMLSRDSISPEFKAYLNERRRALITELTALDKLLGRQTSR